MAWVHHLRTWSSTLLKAHGSSWFIRSPCCFRPSFRGASRAKFRIGKPWVPNAEALSRMIPNWLAMHDTTTAPLKLGKMNSICSYPNIHLDAINLARFSTLQTLPRCSLKFTQVRLSTTRSKKNAASLVSSKRSPETNNHLPLSLKNARV